MISDDLYIKTTEAINLVHTEDETLINDGAKTVASELVYSQRMLAMLEVFDKGSSKLLRLAVQCQHLRRWNIPRTNYSMDRRGYHQWRRAVMEYQLNQTREILIQNKVDIDDIDFILDGLSNQGNKAHATAQIIMDTACLVFIKWYLEAFAAKHEQKKVNDIMKKTMQKMSDKGISLVHSIDLNENVALILSKIV